MKDRTLIRPICTQSSPSLVQILYPVNKNNFVKCLLTVKVMLFRENIFNSTRSFHVNKKIRYDDKYNESLKI